MKDVEKNIEKEIVKEKEISAKDLQEKRNEVLKTIKDYKVVLGENNTNCEDEENFDKDKLFDYDSNDGYKFSFEKIDDDNKQIVYDVFESDPVFALNFIERRKNEIPSDEYDSIKERLIKKMGL